MNTIIRNDISNKYIDDGLKKFKDIYELWKKENDPEHAFILIEHWFNGYVKNKNNYELSSFNEFITNLTNKKVWLLPNKLDDREKYIEEHNINFQQYRQIKISYTDYWVLLKNDNDISMNEIINTIFDKLINKYDDLKSLDLKE